MHTFKKNERLGNYRLRQILFTQGRRFYHHPFAIHWFCFPREEFSKNFTPGILPDNARFRYPAKVLVSVSRRNKANAVSRNRIKRVVKEAYRKNKRSFYSFLERKQAYCLVGMIYAGRKMPVYEHTMDAMQEALELLVERIDKEGLDHLDEVRQPGVK